MLTCNVRICRSSRTFEYGEEKFKVNVEILSIYLTYVGVQFYLYSFIIQKFKKLDV